MVINIKPINKSQFLTDFIKNQKNKFKMKAGFYYRIPALVDVEILYDMNVIFHQFVNLAQYGQLMCLPNDLMNNEKIELIYNTKYGSLESIKQKK